MTDTKREAEERQLSALNTISRYKIRIKTFHIFLLSFIMCVCVCVCVWNVGGGMGIVKQQRSTFWSILTPPRPQKNHFTDPIVRESKLVL